MSSTAKQDDSQEIHEGYYARDFDAVAHELSQLSSDQRPEDLELTAEGRTSTLEVRYEIVQVTSLHAPVFVKHFVLHLMFVRPFPGKVPASGYTFGLVSCLPMQVIGALLTRHVLNNYTRFVQGIDDIARLQSDLQQTLEKIREARQSIQTTSENIAESLRICEESRRKQEVGEVLDGLEKMKATKDLSHTLRSGGASCRICGNTRTRAAQASYQMFASCCKPAYPADKSKILCSLHACGLSGTID